MKEERKIRSVLDSISVLLAFLLVYWKPLPAVFLFLVAELFLFAAADLSGSKLFRRLAWFLPSTLWSGVKILARFLIDSFYEAREWVWTHDPKPRAQWVIAGSLAVFVGLTLWSTSSGTASASKKEVAPAKTVAKTVPPVSVSIPYPDLVPVPLGVDRYKSTSEQQEWRRDEIIESRTFWIMTDGDALAGAKRITQPEYQANINAAAQMYGVLREDIEAIHYLESFGKPKAQSPTGPKGAGQFTARTATGIGLLPGSKCLVKFKGYPCGERNLPETLPPIEEDNREDARLSVYATAKLLAEEIGVFGDRKLGIMSYHSSRDAVRKWVLKYLEPKPATLGLKADIQKYNLTFEELYFSSTPYKNPGTYKMYRTLMNVDWGPNYPWKVLRSAGLLNMYREDLTRFTKIYNDNKFRGKRAKYRMWTFYNDARDEANTLQNLDDLRARIKNGTLVTAPQDPDAFGYKLRLEGAGMVAELDKPNQKHYTATQIYSAGCLMWIGQSFKNLRLSGKASPYLLDITSVSRTVPYQALLTKSNATATKELSFHVLGEAFDISMAGLTPEQDRDLRFILDELDSTGMISWVPELKNKAYHVVVAPTERAHQFFTRYYRDNIGNHMQSPLAIAQN